MNKNKKCNEMPPVKEAGTMMNFDYLAWFKSRLVRQANECIRSLVTLSPQ